MSKMDSFVEEQRRALQYSNLSTYEIIRRQDAAKGKLLAANQEKLVGVKKDISMHSKNNFTFEREINALDQKIALLIKNRISLEEVMASSGDINSMLMHRTTTLKDKREREYYGQLFYLLQRDTVYTATLARLVKLGEIDNFLQTVMFTLYGNQYDPEEEHLLLSMFQRVLKQEFDEATTIGTLLRANTALTRMMTTYTRRNPGQEYLRNTLVKVLTDIISDKDVSLELNPLRIYEQQINDYESSTGQLSTLDRNISPEEAAEVAEVKPVVAARVKKLDELCSAFIDVVIESIQLVPYGIRWICKQIRELAKEKFPNATREQVCSLIGGFFLLRFINPAVVTPQAFMVVDTKLTANSRRNLTMLAKVLQNLANNIQFGGMKEFFMAPLNEFLSSCRPRLNDFLEELTRVDDLDERVVLDQYLRLGRREDIMINITLNEMYFIHQLCVEHIAHLEERSGRKTLRLILADLGPTAPPQLPRKDNANVDLLLISRAETDAKDDMKPEQLYAETKFLLYSLIKALPKPSDEKDESDPKRLAELAIAHATRKGKDDTDLRDKATECLANYEKLLATGSMSASEICSKLRLDAMKEAVDIEVQIEKSAADHDRLQDVLRSILKHSEFLKQQNDAYKQYLANVRESCSTDKKDKKSKRSSSKAQLKGPYKYEYKKMEAEGIIIESEIPADKRSGISFSFSSKEPGVFDVAVSYNRRHIAEMDLQLMLDDLLERQQNNKLEYETDELKLNVNMLIYLLNKLFVA
eukprot:TRINITY_DN26892_c0_g1_i1.p1 TRINITY_DN26892_c0_g1~~TRINITY_DN26892_c0_g1_i1.p1  ORF type:complete len:756 (-),score=243.85 TRINITY_DN26892_c0_g1_i1:278-2545(-)